MKCNINTNINVKYSKEMSQLFPDIFLYIYFFNLGIVIQKIISTRNKTHAAEFMKQI